jgi:hypothetical protein
VARSDREYDKEYEERRDLADAVQRALLLMKSVYTVDLVLSMFKEALEETAPTAHITASAYAEFRRAVIKHFPLMVDYRIEAFVPPYIIHRLDFEEGESYYISVGLGNFECSRR